MPVEIGAATRPNICVDFGTAYSKASIYFGSSPLASPLPLGAIVGAEHALLAPSAMYVEGGQVFFGPAALEHARDAVDFKRDPILSFKMLLSAPEIEHTLALRLNPAVDPTRQLNYRDALVLYLAYLDQIVRAAIASEPRFPAHASEAPRRLTSPPWRSRDAHAILERIFDQASIVSMRLGADLIAPGGIAVPKAREALNYATTAVSDSKFEGVVLEAHAAAVAYASLAPSPSRYVMIVDMGAGTTDIAAFEFEPGAAEATLAEVSEARQCSVLAGDELDNILIELFMRKNPSRRLDAEDRRWRALRLAAKKLKREIFQTKESVFEHARQRRRLRRDTLMKDSSFRAFKRALVDTIANSLRALAAKTKSANAKDITVLLAGGGSNLPFLSDLVRAAAARGKVRARLTIERLGASWASPHWSDPSIAGAFPQVAISMGGALACMPAPPKAAAAVLAATG